MAEDDFCPQCGVSNGLHSGPDTCHLAEAKARLMERLFGKAHR